VPTNKTTRSTSRVTGTPVRGKSSSNQDASAQLALRVAKLEEELAQFRLDLKEVAGGPWWDRVSGTFANDPAFEEAMRLGREWRESFRPKMRNRRSSDDRS
jgi:hypothetical protein